LLCIIIVEKGIVGIVLIIVFAICIRNNSTNNQKQHENLDLNDYLLNNTSIPITDWQVKKGKPYTISYTCRHIILFVRSSYPKTHVIFKYLLQPVDYHNIKKKFSDKFYLRGQKYGLFDSCVNCLT